MIETTLEQKIALDFWVRKIGSCEGTELPMALRASSSNGNSDGLNGRRSWSCELSEADLGYLKKACRGDPEAERLVYVTLYRVLLAYYFGPAANVIASRGLTRDAQGLLFHTAPFDAERTLKEAIGATRAEALEFAPYRDYVWDSLADWMHAQDQSLDAAACAGRFGLVCGDGASVNSWLENQALFCLKVPIAEHDRAFGLFCSPGGDEQLPSQFLRHYVGLVRHLKVNIDRPLRRMRILGEDEVKRLTGALTGPPPEPALPASLLVDFQRQVEATPHVPAIFDSEGALTYLELNERANQLAHFLQEAHGVRRGDFVGIALPDSRNLMVGILAALKCGAAYVPIDLRYPADRKTLLVEESRVIAVIMQDPDDLWTSAAKVVPLSQVKDRIEQCPREDPPLTIDAEDSIYVIFTSGSTGKPKGVAVKHGAFRNLLSWYSREVCGGGPPRFLLIAPISFDLAQKNLFAPLMCGGSLHLLGAALDDYSAMARYISANSIDVINCAPSAFYPLLEFGSEQKFYQLRSLRHVVLGGEPIDTSKLCAWVGAPNFRAQIMNSYGPTEFTDVVSYHQLAAEDLRPDGRSIPIGRPVDGIHLFVLNAQGRLCAPHMVGELYLGGAGLSKGYINDDEEKAKRFLRVDGGDVDFDGILYRTGDLVDCDDDFRLTYVGRVDDQVKINGFRIEVGEVERVIRRLDDVADVVVCPKMVRGERVLVAYFIAGKTLEPQILKRRAAETLPAFAVPIYFCQRTSFPRTPSGKLDKQALPAPSETGSTNDYEAPETWAEERLSRIWGELLKVGQVGRRDDFFALGGHSLTAMLLLSHVSRDFGAQLSLNAVFEHPRLSDLASVISAANPSRFAPIPRLAADRAHEPSNAQRRLWLVSQFESASQAYNLHSTYEIRGQVAPERLEAAFLRVIEKHESLRTIFQAGPDGSIKQVVRPATSLQFHIERVPLPRGTAGDLEGCLAEFVGRPFDLAEGPLLRAALVELDDERQVFTFAIHHIVCDAWSLGVFVTDLLRFYDPGLAGPPVSELAVQYRDYTAWQQDRLESGHDQDLRRFWLEYLAGVESVPPLDLPACHARPKVKTYRGAVIEHSFAPALVSKLEALGARTGCTLFMALVAALKATLFRQTGQSDITIGTAVAGRDHVDLEDQIGFYVNTLPLRTSLFADDTFEAVLAKVKASSTDAFDHRSYPFDAIVDDLKLRRDPSRGLVFDLLVVLQNATENRVLNRIDGADFRLQRRRGPQRFSKFDATFNFSDQGPAAGLVLEVEYNTDLYDREALRRFIDALATLLDDVAEDASRPLWQLRCLPAHERTMILDDFGRGRVDPDCSSFLSLFAASCAGSAADDAILFEEGAVSYADLDARSDQFAGFLAAEMGVRPGDYVGVLYERNDWLVACLVGVLKAGAAFVPLDVAYPARRIDFILNDCDCKVVVDASLVKRFRERLGSWPMVPAIPSAPEAVAYVIYTSGSTGTPKGVEITHDNLAAFLQWCLREFAATDFGVVFAATSICFDLSIFELFFSLSARKAIRLIPSPAHIGEWLGAHERVLLNTVPSVILELCRSGRDLSNVTAINVAGEPASPMLRELLDCHRIEVRNLYGPSEDTTYSTVYRFDDTTQTVPIGRPIDNTRVYLLDPFLQPVGIGVAGEVYLSGRGVCRGYVNRPDLNQESFIHHPAFLGERMYRTGDFARWLPDGNLTFLGRRDAQVKVRGRRIELGEIEVAMLRLPGVRSVAVVIREEGGAADLEAYYACDEGAERAPDQDAVRNGLATFLPSYMVPPVIVRLERLPLTPNGKVDKRALLAREDAPRRARGPAAAAPESDLEQRMLAIWRSVVDAPEAGIDHSYFDLGGDSLRAMTLVARLNETLGSNLGISDLYRRPTVRQLSAQVQLGRERPEGAEPPIASRGTVGAPTSEAKEYPITPFQSGIYYLQRLDPLSTAYNIPFSFVVRGPLDVARLQSAIALLVQRHDAFRTRFDIRNRKVVGLVAPSADIEVVHEELEARDGLRGFVQPFDLSRAPLLRATLVKTSDDEHHVLIDVHHLVFDGASIVLLLNELAQLYRGVAPAGLERLGYADYALLQLQKEARAVHSRQRDYWIEKLGGDRSSLGLPFDFPRGRVQQFSGDYVDLRIGVAQTQMVEALARAEGTTVFSVLFSLFAGALSHICRRPSITMGIPVECRRDPRVQRTIGMFVNTLAVQVEVDRSKPLPALLAAHGAELFAALDHQEYPFETLVRDLGITEGGSYNPLFEVMLAYYPFVPIKDVLLEEGLVLQHRRVDRPKISKFPLTFLVDELEEGMRVSLNYDSTLFKRETVEAMAAVVRAVFDLLSTPSAPLSTLPPFEA